MAEVFIGRVSSRPINKINKRAYRSFESVNGIITSRAAGVIQCFKFFFSLTVRNPSCVRWLPAGNGNDAINRPPKTCKARPSNYSVRALASSAWGGGKRRPGSPYRRLHYTVMRVPVEICTRLPNRTHPRSKRAGDVNARRLIKPNQHRA